MSSRLAKLVGVLLAARTAWRAAAHREAAPMPPESDVDPSELRIPANRRAETLVAVLLLLAGAIAVGFTAVYVVAGTNAQLLGLTLGGALALLAAALILAGKFVVPQETAVEERGPLLVEAQAEEVVELIEEGGRGISRRVLLVGAGGVAGAAVVTAAAAPTASVGPTLQGIHETPWHAGVRLVDDQGRPYLAGDIEIGTFYTALPEHGDPEHFGSALLVVKLPGEQIRLPPSRQAWAPDGILAYSKICTHAGCAVSLYRYPTYQPTSDGPAFTCPCHYSTFSAGEGGRVLFGPAGRALPQLPLTIDGQGYLRAAGPFHEDVGPSWWNVRRGRT